MLSCINYHANNVTARGQHCVAPKCVFQVQWFFNIVSSVFIVSLEVINLIVWWVSNNFTHQAWDIIRICFVLDETNRSPKLPVSLTIQLISTNEYCSFRFSCISTNKVSWKSFILVDFDKISNFEIL